ncbi:MAG TPA: hypothetical protein VGJ04_07570, partial [Pirellulales bacterium]
WNLLNYGRLLNNIRFQDATFRELVAAYQQSVLNADQEVENGIVTFLKEQERAKLLRESVDAAYLALEVVVAQYENPTTIAGAGADFNRYAVILQNLIVQQDQWAQARGQIALGLIQTYRALGGGWQIRCNPQIVNTDASTVPDGSPTHAPEEIPAPQQELPTPANQSGRVIENPVTGSPMTFPPTPAPGTLPSSSEPAVLPTPSSSIPANAPEPMPSSSAPATAPFLVPPQSSSPATPSDASSGTSSLRILPTPQTPSASPLELPSPMPELGTEPSAGETQQSPDAKPVAP